MMSGSKKIDPKGLLAAGTRRNGGVKIDDSVTQIAGEPSDEARKSTAKPILREHKPVWVRRNAGWGVGYARICG